MCHFIYKVPNTVFEIIIFETKFKKTVKICREDHWSNFRDESSFENPIFEKTVFEKNCPYLKYHFYNWCTYFFLVIMNITRYNGQNFVIIIIFHKIPHKNFK